jgi:hypothetical protein
MRGANLGRTLCGKSIWQNERCDDGRATHYKHDFLSGEVPLKN